MSALHDTVREMQHHLTRTGHLDVFVLPAPRWHATLAELGEMYRNAGETVLTNPRIRRPNFLVLNIPVVCRP